MTTMTIPRDASASMQARVCFIAALLFTLASSGTNVIYGWNKGTDLPSSLVWAGVSLGVSVIFALSWPAFILSLDRKQWSRAALVFVALLITGAYSVTAALGSASGGRLAAAAEEKTSTDTRKKAQAAYDEAKAELASIPASRPAAELQVLIAANETELSSLPATRPLAQLQQLVQSPRFSQDCAAVNGSMRVVCPRSPQLQAELERAQNRQKLQGTIADLKAELARSERRWQLTAIADAAAAKLETMGADKIANTDAAALALYLQALGFKADTETINRLLVLLAVIVIECGGGFSLAVGMALDHTVERSERSDREIVQTVRTANVHSNERANAEPERNADFECTPSTLQRSPAPNERLEQSAHARVLSVLSASNGVLFGSQGALGRSFGWSKTRMHEVLRELEAAGRVKLQTSRHGTAVRLVAGTA